jgi:hypothetical protein
MGGIASSLALNGKEPHYWISYLRENLETIRSLTDEDRYLYLSYSDFVNREYSRCVHWVIIGEVSLRRMRENGVTEEDRAYKEKLKDLERHKENLERETERFLEYVEMEIRIMEIAFERMDKIVVWSLMDVEEFNILLTKLRLEEIVNMPEEDRFLYLRDKGHRTDGYMQLVDDMVDRKRTLSRIRPEWTEEDEERFLNAEKDLEKIKISLRRETERMLKVLAFKVASSERALEIAKQNAKKGKETEPTDI